ncbi:MAG: carbon starvation CstA family protein, partial [Planctomycetota bacterium]
IASIFALYPATVIPVWASLPLAVWVGSRIRAGASPLGPSLIALAVLYAAVWVGIAVPVDLSTLLGWPLKGPLPNVITGWTGVLLVYCAVASVLPVGWLLQPRDFLNSLQLGVAVVLLLAGLFVAGVTGVATMDAAPAVVPSAELPDGAPPIFPFLFVTIACGACSGFHCLVASGTTSKQLDVETDAKPIGYGGMLSEAGLAVIVILACTAGLGIGVFEKVEAAGSQSAATFEPVRDDAGVPLTGSAAWRTKYDATGAWDKFGLGQKVGAFVEGGANFLGAIGLPTAAGITLIATLVACFAATTLDSATRLQRYVVQGLAADLRVAPLKNKYVATAVAVVTGGGLALVPANPTLGPGSGGLLLWPLFGATNQVLAGLAFLVIAFYVRRLGKPVWFLVPAGVLMLVVPATAMAWNITRTWGPSAIADGSASLWTLIGLGVAIVALQVWLCVEAWLAWGDIDDSDGTAAERQADVSSQAALPTTPC